MRRSTTFLVAVAATVGLVALIGPAPGHADGQSASCFPSHEKTKGSDLVFTRYAP
jgi:hypothetical protein